MNTEIFDYLKKLAQKEFFFVNLLNSVLGIIIIIMGILGLIDGVTVVMYAFMFAAGALMLLLNFYKGLRRGSKNKGIFLISALVFAAISAFFFYAMMR